MKIINPRRYPLWVQYTICIGLVLVASGITFALSPRDRVIALSLLLTVSVTAMLFDVAPVIVSAFLSVVIWIFFSPVGYYQRLSTAEDIMFFIFYFMVVLINVVMTFEIRKSEQKARMKDEQDHLIRLYNDLLNSLSHELRTPISSIIGALDTLHENNDNLSGEDKAELLSVITKGALRLDREVGDLLNMGRLESGMLRLKIDWCNISDVIYAAIRKVQSDHARDIRYLPAEDLPLFRLDAGIIEQAIYNLLHNAFRHTPDDSLVTITAARDGDACMITVSDNGPGIPEAEIPLVFNKFHRLTTSKPGGSGLGLSIVKGFVEAHHGTIRLENNPDGGARFTLIIPTQIADFNLNNSA